MMLKATFKHLRGISAKKEAALWRSGIWSWEDYAQKLNSQRSFDFHKDKGIDSLHESALALETTNSEFFAKKLPQSDYYRIALSYPKDTLFLDIETTGLSFYYHDVTLIGWSIDGRYDAVVAGDSIASLTQVLKRAKALVTFNGSLFDLRFLKAKFPELQFPSVHIDLRFLSRRAGIGGKQKDIEKRLKFFRPAYLKDIQGESAPILWHKYRRGDIDSLHLLVAYNHADVEGMKFILDESIARLNRTAGFPQELQKRMPRFSNGNLSETLSGLVEQQLAHVNFHAFKGRKGPPIRVLQLLREIRDPITAVGIDLTGSEKRHTGWCLLNGSSAQTKTLATDNEIIAESIKCNPDVVSIDSPLSLPHGRIRVDNSDPGRHKYGIMRECERLLKKRGVNSYPALIDSMQQLTARGIRLAKAFRKLGVPVIESYPGAAQDIMGIPRKRKGLEFLVEGLAEFGIIGDYQKVEKTHDEIDAITSALVGIFFWAGRFESLGTTEEEALIVPEIKNNRKVWSTRRLVGISGPLAAGKTTLAKHLQGSGFAYVRYSAILAEMLEEKGEPVTRETLQRIGERINRKPGQRWLNRRLVSTLPEGTDVVIDGLRFPDDHAFLVETFGPMFSHVHLSTPRDLRRQRYIDRGGSGKEFDVAETHPVEQSTEYLAKLADECINNVGSLSKLYKQVTISLQVN